MPSSNSRFKQKKVVIIGAAGGLGSAFARAFLQEGAHVIVTGRSQPTIEQVATSLWAETGSPTEPYTLDITNRTSLAEFAVWLRQHIGQVDVMVNAAGYDVRKSFAQHTEADIQQLVDINLSGAIFLTQALLPLFIEAGQGTLLHIGGFADGRLAFPYYTVDAATRAGLRSFIEALNRELAHPNIHISYFCPTAADTDAERPYHPIWREMGVAIAPASAIADALLDAVARQQRVTVMGIGTRWFARLNAVFPNVADKLLMHRYRDILKRHLG